jgi:hypothetical protein
LRDSNYVACDDLTIADADSATDVIVYSIHDLNISSPTYDQDLLAILDYLNLHEVETIYGCSYTTLCLKVCSSSNSCLDLFHVVSAPITRPLYQLQSQGHPPQ